MHLVVDAMLYNSEPGYEILHPLNCRRSSHIKRGKHSEALKNPHALVVLIDAAILRRGLRRRPQRVAGRCISDLNRVLPWHSPCGSWWTLSKHVSCAPALNMWSEIGHTLQLTVLVLILWSWSFRNCTSSSCNNGARWYRSKEPGNAISTQSFYLHSERI